MLSILVPAYNSSRYIAETINSILNQEYHDFELLVYDDASTDNTLDIINGYKDSRIRVFSGKSNLGVRGARDFLLSVSNGEYISFVDSDDICNTKKFKKQIDFLSNNHDVHVLGSRIKYINEKGKSIFYPFSFEHFSAREVKINLLFNNTISTSTVVFRASLKKTISFSAFPFDIAEDYFIWNSLSKQFNIVNIKERLVSYRIINSSLMHVNNHRLRDALNYIQKPLLDEIKIPDELHYYHNAFLYTQIKSRIHLTKNILLYNLLFNAFSNNSLEIKKVIKVNFFRKCLNYSRYNPITSLIAYSRISLYLNIFSIKYFIFIFTFGMYSLVKSYSDIRKKVYE